jgi:YNFM family putative membrane transporter
MADPSLPIARGSAAYRRLSLALLLTGFATFALLYGVQPLLPLFAAEFALDAEEASLSVSLATGTMAVAILAAGALSDRIGRRPLVLGSLAAAALLTTATAALPGWDGHLVMRLLTGLSLAGVPAVAMAYVAEEVDAASIGPAMGLYVAGTAVGGMAGRLGAAVLADLIGWRSAIGAVGTAGLIVALLVWRTLPPSRGFAAHRHGPRSFAGGLGRLLSDAALPWLYAEAFLLMGAFVTVYNYAGFRLIAPPYSLSQSAVGAIFLLYLVGSYSSARAGDLAPRFGRRRIFWMPIAALLAGVALTAAAPLPIVIAGIAVVTAGFFGAHSIASAWVGRRGKADRGQAAALYLFFYYLGSSLLGSTGGVAWTRAGWPGVAAFVGVLTLAALAIAVRLSRVPPLDGDGEPAPGAAALD